MTCALDCRPRHVMPYLQGILNFGIYLQSYLFTGVSVYEGHITIICRVAKGLARSIHALPIVPFRIVPRLAHLALYIH